MFRSKKAGILLRILLIALLAYMIFLWINVQKQITATQVEIKTLNEQVIDQTQTNTELSNAIENRDDPSYLQDVARERLDLVTPDDRVFYITD